MEEIVLEEKEVISFQKDSPSIMWFFNPKSKFKGFLGENIECKDIIGINLGNSLIRYGVRKSEVYGTIFALDYLFLHELTHWATDLDNGHEKWLKFLCNLLISLKKRPSCV